MSEWDELLSAWDDAQYASEKRRTYLARLGRGDGTLTTDRIGYVWARVMLPAGVSTLVIKAHRITVAYGALADVRRDTDGYYEAFRASTSAGGQEYWERYGTGNVPQHASSHGLYGPDPAFLMSPQFLPLAVKPTSPSSTSVTVYGGVYRDDAGVLQELATSTVDLSSEIAALSGDEQQLVVIALDITDGTLTKTTNTAIDDPADRVHVPFDRQNALDAAALVGTNEIPLHAVRIYADQTTIVRNDLPEWLDLREWISSGSSGSRTLATQTADVTVANTTTKTTLIGTVVGSVTLPAAALAVGTTLRITGGGQFDTVDGTPSLTFRIDLGGTTILDSGGGDISSGAVTTGGWHFESLLTCRSAGASGTIVGNGLLQFGTVQETLRTASAVVIDTTGTLVLNITVEWSAADPANSITAQTMVLELQRV